jgi:hypothetical protein
MAYTRTTWVDYPATTTPITAASLNNLELGVVNATAVTDAITSGAWTTYTPTWTSLTVGNATQEAAYLRVGRMYVVRFRLTFGSTTSISGQPEITLPNSASVASGYTDGTPLGLVQFADVGVASYLGQIAKSASVATRVRMYSLNVSGTYLTMGTASNTVPFTWGTSDVIDGQFVFEAAS